jgi:sugar phosphate isomerase/epimerase
MRFSISTNWNSHRHTTADSLFDEIRSLGFDTVELGYDTTQTQMDGIRKHIDSGKIKVASIHAFCPNKIVGASGPEIYSLCDPDDFKRAKKGIAAAEKCADFAASIGAKTVVLHAGRVPVFRHVRALAHMVADGKSDTPKYEKKMLRMITKRDKKSAPLLDTLYESLEILLPHYAARGVTLALENFSTYDGIPSETEMAELLREFEGLPLAYWHDFGHGQIRQHHGVTHHKSMISAFRKNTAGMHIHDVIFPDDDHYAPGVKDGVVDFKILKDFIPTDIPLVLEPSRKVSPSEIVKSLEMLNALKAESL